MERHIFFLREIMALRITRKETENFWLDHKENFMFPINRREGFQIGKEMLAKWIENIW